MRQYVNRQSVNSTDGGLPSDGRSFCCRGAGFSDGGGAGARGLRTVRADRPVRPVHAAESTRRVRVAARSASRSTSDRVDLGRFGGSALVGDRDDGRLELANSILPTRRSSPTSRRATRDAFVGARMGRGAGRRTHRDRRQRARLFGLSGLPPEFIAAFEYLASLATKAGVEGKRRASGRRCSTSPRRPSFAPASSWAWTTG